MKRIKKLVSALAVAGTVVAMLAGCSEETTGGATGTANPDSGATNVLQLEDVNKYITVGDYNNITIELSNIYAVDDALVEQYVGYYYQQAAAMVTADAFILDRAVEDGDMINLDYTGYKDEVAFEGGSTNGAGTVLWIGSNSYIDGFESGLVDVMPGETVDLNLTFPEEYGAEDLAGADVVFNVTVNGIIPEEEIVSSWCSLTGGTATTRDDIGDYYAEMLRESSQSTYNDDVDVAIQRKILEMVEVVQEFPGAVILTYQTNYSDTLEYYANMYGTDVDSIANYFLGTTADNYIVNGSYEQLKFDVACRYIAEQENLMISDEELYTRAQQYLIDLGYETTDEVLAQADMDEFRLEFMLEDVLDYLRGVVTVTILE